MKQQSNFRLSDTTRELLRLLADAATTDAGFTVSQTDVLESIIRDTAKARKIKPPPTNPPAAG